MLCVAFAALGDQERGDGMTLWAREVAVPTREEAPIVAGARYHTIAPWQPEVDGFRWLHGAALAWHNGRLWACWGANAGAENTLTEVTRAAYSDDGGRTWSEAHTIAAGSEDEGNSHGVLLSHRGRLWALVARFGASYANVRTEALVLDEASGAWESRGIAAGDGFWAMNQPVTLSDGALIMPGICVGGPPGEASNPAAVAISPDGNPAAWQVVRIPPAEGLDPWGESAIIVEGRRVRCIARNRPDDAVALVAQSEDAGRTWTPMTRSALPMGSTKPCAGLLSSGQRYLLSTTLADTGAGRCPLTIALDAPGERELSRVLRVRESLLPGESEERRTNAVCYPYASEHDGALYVAYSVRRGSGNENAIELAAIPLEGLTGE